jgi:hypothetical protein
MSTYLKKAGLFNQNLMDSLQKMGIMTPGELIFLDPTNGDDTWGGKTIDRAVKTLPVAYELLTAGQHDVLVYIAGSTSLSIAESFTWAKDYTHFIGVSAGVPMAQRTRIFHSANFSPMITFSASGCIWSNLYFSYGRGGADNHVLMALTGDRNVFDNIHFAAMNHQTEADDASSVGIEMTAAHENLFKNCVFGNDTIERGAANATISMLTGCARNKMSNCLFESWADNAGPVAIKVAADGLDRFLWLEDTLIANHGTSLTQAIDSNITDTSARKIYVTGEFNTIGCTDVADATGDGTIFVKSPTTTANAVGIAINPAVS